MCTDSKAIVNNSKSSKQTTWFCKFSMEVTEEQKFTQSTKQKEKSRKNQVFVLRRTTFCYCYCSKLYLHPILDDI